MAANETIVEIVRFQEAGLDVISARTAAFAKQLDEATRYSQALSSALGSPAFAKHAQRMGDIARTTERNTLALKNQTRAADLASGAYAKQAAAMGRLNAESRRLDQREALAGLVAQHGRLGGVIRHNAADLLTLRNVALGLAGAGLAMGVGLARSGLAGTQEGVRLEMQWTRLARQMAAIAIPVLEKVGNVLNWVSGKLEGMSGNTQAFLAKIATIAVVAAPAIFALRMLASGAKALWAIGASGLAAAGMSGAVAASAAATAGAGAAGGLGGTAAAAAGGGMLAGVGRAALRAAIPVAIVAAAIEMAPARTREEMEEGHLAGYYARLRREGRSKLGAGFASIGKGFEAAFAATGLTTETSKEEEDEKKRRDVTPFAASSEDLGGAHFRIQEELLKVEMARDEEVTALGTLTAAIDKFREMFEKLGAGDGPGFEGKEGGVGGWYADRIRAMVRGWGK